MTSADGTVTLDIIILDTVRYTGVKKGSGYPVDPVDPDQQAWLEKSMAEYNADYLLIATHYPVYSMCFHGNTLTLINHVKPLLEKYKAHFISGHDHCGESIELVSSKLY